jgi:hypothetical protein
MVQVNGKKCYCGNSIAVLIYKRKLFYQKTLKSGGFCGIDNKNETIFFSSDLHHRASSFNMPCLSSLFASFNKVV